MFDDLAGKVAVVTGGARGLGFAMAGALVEHGVRAVLGIPVKAGAVTVGSLDVYRSHPHAWDDSERDALQRALALLPPVFRVALVLREYAGSLGHNFFVLLNDRMLGSIMENLEFTLENVVFDNSVVICYEEQYLPLLTAMAIMVAREIARDDEKENS